MIEERKDTPPEGIIEQCAKYTKMCDYKCCIFKDNYILMYPGEREDAKFRDGKTIEHLEVLDEDGYRGLKVVCTRRCGDGDYKPLDCASYPYFPVVKNGLITGLIKGEKCPLIQLRANIGVHALWVLRTWQELIDERPLVGKWLEETEMVGYVPEEGVTPIYKLEKGKRILTGACFGRKGEAGVFHSIWPESPIQVAQLKTQSEALKNSDHRLFKEVVVDAPLATLQGIKVPVKLNGMQEYVSFSIVRRGEQEDSIWDTKDAIAVEELARLYAGCVYNVLANHSHQITRTFETSLPTSTMLADWAFNEALNFEKEMEKKGWEMHTPKPWRTATEVFSEPMTDFKYPLVPISGGKESMTTAALLMEADYNWAAVFFDTESVKANRFWATESAMYKDSIFPVKTRVVTTDFARVLYDKIPRTFGAISTFIPFISTPASIIAMLDGNDAVLIGNEYDCSMMIDEEATGRYWGANYDQSSIWSRKFSFYIQQMVMRRLHVMSILDNLSETAIQWILRDLRPDWLPYQVSCDKPVEGVRNCGECIKCRRIAALLTSIGSDPGQMGLTFDPTIFEESVDTVFSGADGQVEFNFWKDVIAGKHISQETLDHVLGVVVDAIHPPVLPPDILKVVEPILRKARQGYGGR